MVKTPVINTDKFRVRVRYAIHGTRQRERERQREKRSFNSKPEGKKTAKRLATQEGRFYFHPRDLKRQKSHKHTKRQRAISKHTHTTRIYIHTYTRTRERKTKQRAMTETSVTFGFDVT